MCCVGPARNTKPLLRKVIKCISLPSSKLTNLLILFSNIMLSTLLILAICRSYVIHELFNRPCSPQSLWASVVEHWRAESQGLRFNSSWGLRNFSLSHTSDETKNILLIQYCFQTDHLSMQLVNPFILNISVIILLTVPPPILLNLVWRIKFGSINNPLTDIFLFCFSNPV